MHYYNNERSENLVMKFNSIEWFMDNIVCYVNKLYRLASIH